MVSFQMRESRKKWKKKKSNRVFWQVSGAMAQFNKDGFDRKSFLEHGD
jgi:hypothetical protein